jgi:hypothetical protein
MTACVYLNPAQYREREDERQAAIAKWRVDNAQPEGWPPELSALNALYFPPGTMWSCPWYHDPEDPEDVARIDAKIARMLAEPDKHWHLSLAYWQTWARIRPPLCVVCPGGGQWVIDSVSTNGPGWTVTGEAPRITATPSIWVGQGAGPPREYHGFLNDGVFSPPV